MWIRCDRAQGDGGGQKPERGIRPEAAGGCPAVRSGLQASGTFGGACLRVFSCGYVEFYADDPQTLYDAFMAAQQDTPQIT